MLDRAPPAKQRLHSRRIGFEPLQAHGCRFHNCRHRQDPGCAVAELVDKGEISSERYQTYLALLAEVEGTEEEALRRARKK